MSQPEELLSSYGSAMGQFLTSVLKPFEVVLCESLKRPPIHVPASSYLYRQGDPCDGLYVLEEGIVELLLESKGHTKRLVQRTAPAVIGLAECISREGRCSSAKVIQDSTLQFASIEAVRELLHSDTIVCMQAAALISDEISCSLDLINRFHASRSGTRK